MSEDTASTPEIVHLPSGGSLPGIPGSHGPGVYLVNWLERTIVPFVAEAEATVEYLAEEVHLMPEPATPESAPAAQIVEEEPAP